MIQLANRVKKIGLGDSAQLTDLGELQIKQGRIHHQEQANADGNGNTPYLPGIDCLTDPGNGLGKKQTNSHTKGNPYEKESFEFAHFLSPSHQFISGKADKPVLVPGSVLVLRKPITHFENDPAIHD